jgi:hypothetical protein
MVQIQREKKIIRKTDNCYWIWLLSVVLTADPWLGFVFGI